MTEAPANTGPDRLSAVARQAATRKDWATVHQAARTILQQNRKNPEGWFLSGLAEKAAGRLNPAMSAMAKALRLDRRRYDAAVELAELQVQALQHRKAVDLLEEATPLLSNSPLYLDRAARVFSRLGLHAKASPLLQRAVELQPGAQSLRANLAANSVLVGELEQATELYRELLRQNPQHQRNHYELSRLVRAEDRVHVDRMLDILNRSTAPPSRNIFLYYAIAKQLEDLGEWSDSFDYYRRGGDAAADAARQAGYRVSDDVALIEQVIETCSADWLSRGGSEPRNQDQKTPVFVVGLPRTGTTLTERIIASHAKVESADETFFLQMAIRRAVGAAPTGDLTPEIVRSAADCDTGAIASNYFSAIGYRLSDKPWFIDKYPFNYLYLGFIAKAFPEARIVHLRRRPMDACFAMFKQSFFRFAYTLQDLGEYYVAYDRLSRHWTETLGERLIEVHYESLVSDLEPQTRLLLDRLGLEFDPACLEFHRNAAPSATASAAQVREKAHTRSIDRWKNVASELEPLRQRLHAAGIENL